MINVAICRVPLFTDWPEHTSIMGIAFVRSYSVKMLIPTSIPWPFFSHSKPSALSHCYFLTGQSISVASLFSDHVSKALRNHAFCSFYIFSFLVSNMRSFVWPLIGAYFVLLLACSSLALTTWFIINISFTQVWGVHQDASQWIPKEFLIFV